MQRSSAHKDKYEWKKETECKTHNKKQQFYRSKQTTKVP